MTKQDKELLLKDLCARLPYGVMCNRIKNHYKLVDIDIKRGIVYLLREEQYVPYSITLGDKIEPYLRPMSSMTEEEIYELKKICDEEDLRDECGDIVSTIYGMTVLYGEVEDVYPYNLKIKISPNLNYSVLDFLNAHQFDYRGLIPIGLALPAPDGMYNFK